jgi:hypothetical protein
MTRRRRRSVWQPDDAQAHQGDGHPSPPPSLATLRLGQVSDGGSEGMAQPDRIINFVERARARARARTCTAMLSNKKDPNSEFGLLENKIPALQGCGRRLPCLSQYDLRLLAKLSSSGRIRITCPMRRWRPARKSSHPMKRCSRLAWSERLRPGFQYIMQKKCAPGFVLTKR